MTENQLMRSRFSFLFFLTLVQHNWTNWSWLKWWYPLLDILFNLLRQFVLRLLTQPWSVNWSSCIRFEGHLLHWVHVSSLLVWDHPTTLFFFLLVPHSWLAVQQYWPKTHKNGSEPPESWFKSCCTYVERAETSGEGTQTWDSWSGLFMTEWITWWPQKAGQQYIKLMVPSFMSGPVFISLISKFILLNQRSKLVTDPHQQDQFRVITVTFSPSFNKKVYFTYIAAL